MSKGSIAGVGHLTRTALRLTPKTVRLLPGPHRQLARRAAAIEKSKHKCCLPQLDFISSCHFNVVMLVLRHLACRHELYSVGVFPRFRSPRF